MCKQVVLLLCPCAYVTPLLLAQSLQSRPLQAMHLPAVREEAFISCRQTVGGDQGRHKHLRVLAGAQRHGLGLPPWENNCSGSGQQDPEPLR